jgi:hypothetical protein
MVLKREEEKKRSRMYRMFLIEGKEKKTEKKSTAFALLKIPFPTSTKRMNESIESNE